MSIGSSKSTQPISAASLPLPTGAAQDGTDISAPTAMPSGGSGIRGWLSAIWTKLNGSIAVTGTFWQATQPVSIASMPSTPVTGTFWQATQPVSFTWAGLTDTQLRASALPVSGTFWQATQPVSLASLPALVAGSAIIGKVGIDQSTPGTTNLVQVGGSLPAGSNVIGALTANQSVNVAQMGGTALAAVAKGTQGANAIPTQDLKDSGRVAISFTAEFSPTATAEAMLTMSVSKDGATATTGTSYAITSGKRLRICSKSIAVENTLGTSIQRAYLRTRFAATGGALVTSPLQANCIASAAGTVKSVGSNFDDYPDGMEFLGDGTKAIGWSLTAPDWVSATSTCKVYVTIIGYEY